MKAKAKSPVLWPLLGLAALVLLNAVHDTGFLKITLLDGHLYGVPVDILTQGSRTMLVALGMTLVIATGGVGQFRSARWWPSPVRCAPCCCRAGTRSR